MRTTRRDRSRTEADLARAVIGFGYRFDDRTRFVGEFEWEHAVTSAEDQGRGGRRAVLRRARVHAAARRSRGPVPDPVGHANTAHEPTQYFGVTRDFVNTSIIPTTWREAVSR